MPGPNDASTQDVSRVTSGGLPPGRLEELRPRLQALLADFAHLAELETVDLEPQPVYVVAQIGDQHE
ncbi:MAG: hypothetical protein M3Z20_06515 [Chloroflexota bacterium]|nr:hypothetical protein [Chloroflexota bacterium]